MDKQKQGQTSRRKFLTNSLSVFSGLSVAGVFGLLIKKTSVEEMVWQLDPELCIQCEKCATNCVLAESAVKCVHSYSMCGYCDLCSGYLLPEAKYRNTGAENMLCPTGAIKRNFIEDPYFEYIIDKKLCIGCAKCVKGCGAFGNGSLYLQIQHDLCLNCNECSIARSCPANAFKRLPASNPYILRGEERDRQKG